VEVDPAGGGAAAVAERQPGAKHCRRQGRAEQRSTCSRRKKRGRGSEGPIWKFQEFQGPYSKERFPTDLEV
jgi:hypothetical protein